MRRGHCYERMEYPISTIRGLLWCSWMGGPRSVSWEEGRDRGNTGCKDPYSKLFGMDPFQTNRSTINDNIPLGS